MRPSNDTNSSDKRHIRPYLCLAACPEPQLGRQRRGRNEKKNVDIGRQLPCFLPLTTPPSQPTAFLLLDEAHDTPTYWLLLGPKLVFFLSFFSRAPLCSVTHDLTLTPLWERLARRRCWNSQRTTDDGKTHDPQWPPISILFYVGVISQATEAKHGNLAGRLVSQQFLRETQHLCAPSLNMFIPVCRTSK